MEGRAVICYAEHNRAKSRSVCGNGQNEHLGLEALGIVHSTLEQTRRYLPAAGETRDEVSR